MNGPHDLGGQMGFGPVAPEINEPYFHADWEKRALGVTIAAGAMGAWTIDESRHARECLHPADYYSSSYYEIWIKALEALLLRHGFVSTDDFDAGAAMTPAATPKRVLEAANVAAMLARGAPCDRLIDASPKFSAGDMVRTLNFNPEGHTRLPRYARGKIGKVDAVRQSFVLPDTNAHGRGEMPQHVYTVVFDAETIWGEGADPMLSVSIDAWETYLERA
ncbi:nitrile hydratase subunit beta [Mesorhizobium sp. NBSH29]|uniref:nitrile hydratase subunit beta n=1 Tax=Mesorhizobium sp. NBSH29 TaxID=2654249 RepID=UPI001896A3DC|nr:nitrile hydratase subunit beta [Mesorhizobium sp. NBSH29]QPC88152.1 nitrile hydratase subunit beta [Mesorhizobium sp. NBSH29]